MIRNLCCIKTDTEATLKNAQFCKKIALLEAFGRLFFGGAALSIGVPMATVLAMILFCGSALAMDSAMGWRKVEAKARELLETL